MKKHHIRGVGHAGRFRRRQKWPCAANIPRSEVDYLSAAAPTGVENRTVRCGIEEGDWKQLADERKMGGIDRRRVGRRSRMEAGNADSQILVRSGSEDKNSDDG
jgi:hypothetical protein